MTLVVSDFVSRVYQEGVRLGFAREGVAAYMVRRGSNYPCPVCDDVCAVIHPAYSGAMSASNSSLKKVKMMLDHL